MIDEHGIEARLRRFRPAGPPPALRERVLVASTTSPRRVTLWLEIAAAAALMATGLGLNQLSGQIARRIGADLASVHAANEAQLDALAESLGGGVAGRAAAEIWIEPEAPEQLP